MRNKVTDFDIRKSFVDINYPFGSPSILLDGYWEHYMDIFGQTEKYEKFRKDWISEGFKTYKDFADEYGSVLDSIKFDDIFKYSINDMWKNMKTSVDTRIWMPVICANDYANLSGRYLRVDLHHAFDAVLNMMGLYRDEYNSMENVIESYTQHKMFIDMKLLRLNIYYKIGLGHNQILFDICGNLLRKVFESNHPVIRTLNERYKERYLSKGDMYLYKIGDNDDVSGLTGDYMTDGISFSVKCLTCGNISIMDSIYSTMIDLSERLIDYNIMKTSSGTTAQGMIAPLALKLARGEKPTEMDLAIGYEDMVFFHLNENDYKIL